MEIIEDGLEVALDEFLARRLFCVLARRSGEGPRLSPLWFLWEDGAIRNVVQSGDRSYPRRVREYPKTAVAVVDFDPGTGRVEHVGMRSEATLLPYGHSRADRLFEKYLGDERRERPETFLGLDADDYRLVRVVPETVVARDQSYPAPAGGGD